MTSAYQNNLIIFFKKYIFKIHIKKKLLKKMQHSAKMNP